MDDKQFEKLMTEYVGSHKQDKEKMLGKFRTQERADETRKAAKRTPLPKWVWALSVCVLIATVALSVFLPVFLKTDSSQKSEMMEDGFYFNSEDLLQVKVDSLEELESELGYKLPSLNKEYMSLIPFKVVEKDNPDHIVGVALSYSGDVEAISHIDINIFPDKNNVAPLAGYVNLPTETTVKGTKVRYNVINNTGLYYCYVSFKQNKTTYYIKIVGTEVIDVDEVISLLL